MKWYYYGQAYDIVNEFDENGVAFCVCRHESDDYPEYTVIKKSDLRKYEDTETFKDLEKRKKEIADLKEQKDEIVKEIRNKAVKDLAFRMQLNSVFFEDGKYTTTGVILGQELRKLVDKEPVVPKKS